MKIRKSPEELFRRRWEKPRSVEKQIFGFTKHRKNWDEGINFKELKQKVETSLKKVYSDVTIYNGISSLNRFGVKIGIYLRSSSNRNEDGKMEYRYYVPSTPKDISDEERDLEQKEMNVHLKQTNLGYHRTITIPQENQLVEIRNVN